MKRRKKKRKTQTLASKIFFVALSVPIAVALYGRRVLGL